MKVQNSTAVFRILLPVAMIAFCFGMPLILGSVTVIAQTPQNECDYCILQFPTGLSVTSGSITAPIYGRIYEAGVTEPAGPSPSVTAQVGYGPVGTDPRTASGWTYFNASFNVQVSNDDEYQATMVAPSPGTYIYVYRFSLDGGATWSYADTDGAGSNPSRPFDPFSLGIMNVTAQCPESLTPNSQYFSSSAGTGQFTILSQCAWTVTSNVPWITVTSTPSGNGNGQVNYSVAANPDSTQRSGTITVGDQTFTVVQASGACTLILAPGGNLSSGATGNFGIGMGDTTGQGFVSFSITLSYDPAIISFVGIDNAGTLSSGFTVGANVVSPGNLRIAGFGTSPLSGSGTLVYLRFTAVGAIGSTSQVSFTAIEFNEGSCFQSVGTGSISIVGRTVSGSVLYGTSPTPFGVAGIGIFATSGGGAVTTDPNGIYIVTGLGTGSLLLLPQLPSGLPVNGITALDASLVLQAVLGIVTLSPEQVIAADVSGNGSVTTFDAALIAKFAVGLPNTVFAGTWRFSPPSRSYDSLPTDLTGQDFALILMGEVTGNWAPQSPIAGSVFISRTGPEPEPLLTSSTRAIKLSLPLLFVHQGEVTIPVSLENYDGQLITSFQFDLQYDPSVIVPGISPVDLTATLSEGFAYEVNAGEPGRLRVAVYGTNSIAGNGTLINLRMNTVGPLKSRTDLILGSAILNEGRPGITTQNGKLGIRR